MSELFAHGMGIELVPPTWPPLTAAEVAAILSHYPLDSRSLSIDWISPRPFSAGALVSAETGRMFVKRHHRSLRTPADLSEEHRFIAHLSARGVPVPQVFTAGTGATAVVEGDWSYEVHSIPDGVDVYRDALSWTAFHGPGHARAAGSALGRLHLAAADYTAPVRRTQPLMTHFDLVSKGDPLPILAEMLIQRPALRSALAGRDWQSDLTGLFLPFHHVFLSAVGGESGCPDLGSCWTHNDWHASNLFFSSAESDASVAAVIDFGLANRTVAVLDLAIALERNTIGWLELGRGDVWVDYQQATALIEGYEDVRSLSPIERAALPALLPLAHVEYALSEMEYFHGITRSAADTDLAYDYLIDHLRWFASISGREYLSALTAMLA